MKVYGLCRPTNFNVDYVINPWMEGNAGLVDSARALTQWENLVAALNLAGAATYVIPAHPVNCPDAVFTANSGLCYGSSVILSRFYHDERRAEEDFFARTFEQTHKVDRRFINADVRFEGEGDALLQRDGNLLWLGFGFRTDERAAPLLQEALRVRVVPLRLVDPRFYHLDTCFCPTELGTIYYPKAFDSKSLELIYSHCPPPLVPVSEAEALTFVCNSVPNLDRLVTPKIGEELKARLEKLGFRVHEVELDEFIKSGGAAKCLTLDLTNHLRKDHYEQLRALSWKRYRI